MPREPLKLTRESGEKEPEKLYIIACEGVKTEHEYFDAFMKIVTNNLVKFELLVRPPEEVGHSAPQHVLKQLKKHKKDQGFEKKKGDEYWMLVDTDSWPNLQNILEECGEDQMFHAVTNPCFELWLLLHKQDVGSLSNEDKSNILENGKVSAKKRYLEKHLNDVLVDLGEANYRKNSIGPERFLANVDVAIARAKAMYSEGETQPIDKLGSHVFKLVEKLI
jgi:hypothetical protein